MNQKRNGRNLRNVACLIGRLRALRSSFVTSILAGSVGKKGLSIPAFLYFNVCLTRSKPGPSLHIRASPESCTWCVCVFVFLPVITQVTLNQDQYCTTPARETGNWTDPEKTRRQYGGRMTQKNSWIGSPCVCWVTEYAAATSFSKSGIVSLPYFWRNYYCFFLKRIKWRKTTWIGHILYRNCP